MLHGSCSLLISQPFDGPELTNPNTYHTGQGDEQVWEKGLDEANCVELDQGHDIHGRDFRGSFYNEPTKHFGSRNEASRDGRLVRYDNIINLLRPAGRNPGWCSSFKTHGTPGAAEGEAHRTKVAYHSIPLRTMHIKNNFTIPLEPPCRQTETPAGPVGGSSLKGWIRRPERSEECRTG